MAPVKAKVRQFKGMAASAPQAKRSKRADSTGLAPVVSVQGQYQINDKQVAVTIQHDLSQKLDAPMQAMKGLSRYVGTT